MKKYLLVAVSALLMLCSKNGKAQTSEIFAGGEIQLDYIGDFSEDCGEPLPYRITLKFYRDDVGPAVPLDDEKTIFMRNQTSPDRNDWTITPFVLAQTQD